MTDTAPDNAGTATSGTTSDITTATDDASSDAKTDDTDWKARAREWEKRAKENSKAADRLTALEEAQKTNEQKLADRVAAAERERDAAQVDALRYRIATRYGISDEDAAAFLHGPDEETIVMQAERLQALATNPRTPRPDLSQGARQPAAATTGDLFAQAIQNQFTT